MESEADQYFQDCFLRFLLADEVFPHILRQHNDRLHPSENAPQQYCGPDELHPWPLKKAKLEQENDHDHDGSRYPIIENSRCVHPSFLWPGRCAQLRTTEPKVKILFLGFKQEYEKVQSRINGQSRQRIADGKVRIKITADAQVTQVQVYVERAPLAVTLSGDVTGRVPLKVKMGAQVINKQYVSVDLDSVYMSPKGTPVYKLSTVDSDRRNRFRLVVVITFIDGSQSRAFMSPTFLLRSRRPERAKST